MNPKLLLIKAITLLYRERQLKTIDTISSDLVKTSIDAIPVTVLGLGLNSERDVLYGLKETVNEMLVAPPDHEYDPILLLQRLKINTEDDEQLYDAVRQGIEPELNETQTKRMVTNLRRTLSNFYREDQIGDLLSNAAYKFKNNREQIKDVNVFLNDLTAALEPLQMAKDSKDPATTMEVDLGDEGQTTAVFQHIHDTSTGDGILRTGWQRLNRMCQGGIRRGEFVVIGALQHKYKTGFTLSLFKQIALYNKPYMLDVSKKPLLLRISFEDDLDQNLQFLYQSLRYNETRIPVSVKDVPIPEMSAYIKAQLQVNGYHIKMLRVDPTQSSYRHICSKLLEYEANGYEVHLLMLDYIGVVPTTGCTVSGPSGTDMRDLFRRMRNFCGPKKIALVTPYQLSPDAKLLERSGVPADQFVRVIAEKGYHAGSKQLDQEMDLELYIHLCKHQKDTYLTVQRGKHRVPTILSEEDKYFLLRFPGAMPMLDDIHGEDSGFSRLPSRAATTVDNALFTF